MLVIMQKTRPVDYPTIDIQQRIKKGEIGVYAEPVNAKLPPHVVCLAQGARDAYFVLLDTKRGIIIWGNPDGGWDEPLTELSEDVDLEAPDSRFRELQWMPHPDEPHEVWEVDLRSVDKEDEELQRIMKEAG
ncbi:hypothetical protein K469DRAFT_695966 [Zopfia rhizophila CBS 207.26]|uniref:Uncharacterized protein n=1 Tax=Zopfia rhizophila CBS 207.26 TaxID=1314779 RepID=A0A6A6EPN7_9PEZI|nr:hypothetical protein K469DRAFT_695966 [Zopfia rhizophila CBS 207.26]